MTRTLIALALFALPTLTLACEDYASWRKSNKDCSWTAAAEAAVAASKLSETLPGDIGSFCHKYPSLPISQRNRFWTGLLSAIARPESNYNPNATYTEKFNDGSGKKVVSRGLLQISIESANQKRYSCAIAKAEDLHDPATNLRCGVKILEAWVVQDNTIASYVKGKPRGGGRYWSTLRQAKGFLPELQGNTSALAFCRE